jgi:hypothetical protein
MSPTFRPTLNAALVAGIAVWTTAVLLALTLV